MVKGFVPGSGGPKSAAPTDLPQRHHRSTVPDTSLFRRSMGHPRKDTGENTRRKARAYRPRQ
jgi:hypothetical protein